MTPGAGRAGGTHAKPEAGFEPATPCLQDRCSDQLSYSGGRARGAHVGF